MFLLVGRSFPRQTAFLVARAFPHHPPRPSGRICSPSRPRFPTSTTHPLVAIADSKHTALQIVTRAPLITLVDPHRSSPPSPPLVTHIPSRRSRFPSSPLPTLAALASPRRPRVPSSGLPPSHSRFPSSSAFPSALPLSPSHHLQPALPPSFLPKGWDRWGGTDGEEQMGMNRWGGTDGEEQRWSLPPPQSNSVLIPSLLPTILPPTLSPASAPVPPILFPVSPSHACAPITVSPYQYMLSSCALACVPLQLFPWHLTPPPPCSVTQFFLPTPLPKFSVVKQRSKLRRS
ncbi:unnamed protein product [Closterium sp. Naga37s-1]|nr:unnamed protein product [Closterium sp. Naga37s-1]